MVDADSKKVLFYTSLFKKEELDEWMHQKNTTFNTYFNKLFAPYKINFQWKPYFPEMPLSLQTKTSNPTTVEDIIADARGSEAASVVLDLTECLMAGFSIGENYCRGVSEFKNRFNQDARNRTYIFRTISSGNTGLKNMVQQLGQYSDIPSVSLDDFPTVAGFVLDVVKFTYQPQQQRR
jgi:hypothetical protein